MSAGANHIFPMLLQVHYDQTEKTLVPVAVVLSKARLFLDFFRLFMVIIFFFLQVSNRITMLSLFTFPCLCLLLSQVNKAVL